MTFLSSANAIVYAGGTPVFVDVDPATANIDPAAVAAAITPRTKAIIAVDLYGLLADMVALRSLADRHGLSLVEDAAHCVEGRRDGFGPGRLADYGCFSFYATKNLTCGEGGAITARDGAKKSPPQAARLARHVEERGRPVCRQVPALGHGAPRLQVQPLGRERGAPPAAAPEAREEARASRGDLPPLRGRVPRDAGRFVSDRARGHDVRAPPLHDLGGSRKARRRSRRHPGAGRRRRRELPRRPPHEVLPGAFRFPPRHVPPGRAHRRLHDHDPALARDDGRAGGRGHRGREAAVAEAG